MEIKDLWKSAPFSVSLFSLFSDFYNNATTSNMKINVTDSPEYVTPLSFVELYIHIQLIVWIRGTQLYCFASLSMLSLSHLQAQQAAVLSATSPFVYLLLNTKKRCTVTDTLENENVQTVKKQRVFLSTVDSVDLDQS